MGKVYVHNVYHHSHILYLWTVIFLCSPEGAYKISVYFMQLTLICYFALRMFVLSFVIYVLLCHTNAFVKFSFGIVSLPCNGMMMLEKM